MYKMRPRRGKYLGRRTSNTPLREPPQEEVAIVIPPPIIPEPETEETETHMVTAAAEGSPEQRPSAVEPDVAEGDLVTRTMDRLEQAGLDRFGEAFKEARVQGETDAEEMLDPNDVPIETREMIETLEGDLADEQEVILDRMTRLRLQIAEKGMRALEGTFYFVRNGVPELARSGLEFLDLDTKAKAYAALLEIVPTVAFWYAVTGKRVKFKEAEGLIKEPYLEDIDKMDRILYLAGSVFALGHVWSGIRHSLLRQGFWRILKQHGLREAARALLPALSKLVGPTYARAQRYVLRQIAKDRRPKPSPQQGKTEEPENPSEV